MLIKSHWRRSGTTHPKGRVQKQGLFGSETSKTEKTWARLKDERKKD